MTELPRYRRNDMPRGSLGSAITMSYGVAYPSRLRGLGIVNVVMYRVWWLTIEPSSSLRRRGLSAKDFG